MRPLKLLITGFGTYYKPTLIDFTKLGNEGLYLITGDTGSGKTTIFDAITYALYDAPSGKYRNKDMIRSTFATEFDKTEVEFQFEFRGKTYNVKRNLEYRRKSLRGEGSTLEPQNATLTMPDGHGISGNTEVTKKVEDILGLKKDQFCQIAMIAQGDFQNVLFENSSSRQKIFTVLFRTEKYKYLQEKLAENATELRNKIKSKENLLNHELKNVNCDENCTLVLKLNDAKEKEMALEEKTDIIKEIIDFDKAEKDSLKKKEEENNSNLDEINIKKSEIEKLKDDKEQAEKLKKDILEEEENLTTLKENLEKRKSELEENSSKEKEKVLISNDLDKYDIYDSNTVKLSNLNNEIKDITKIVINGEKNIAEKTDFVKKLEHQLEELKDAGANFEKYSAEKGRINDKISLINEIQKNYTLFEKAEGELKEAQEKFKKAQIEATTANEAFISKNNAYLSGQAGIIAEQLEENHPCPVCGSLEHPAPAKKIESVPTEKEINDAKKSADDLMADATAKSNKAHSLSATVDSKKAEVESAISKVIKNGTIADYGKVTEELNKANEDLASIINKINEVNKNIRQKEEIEQNLPGEKKSLEEAKSALNQNNILLAQKKTEADAVKKSVDELKNQLKYGSKSEANERINKLSKIIETVKQNYENAQNNLNETKEKLSDLKGKLSTINDIIKKADVGDEQKIMNDYFECIEEKKSITAKIQDVSTRLEMNQRALKNINSFGKEMAEIEKEYNMVNSLSVTANGTLTGHEKIQLETFIQMSYLDKVLKHANSRLCIMSEGQYELVRKTEDIGKKGQSGLDIDVIDHYSGFTRSIKSLSGGECFQASLALALGLSDEVSCSAGGIKIDSMFIDEGFGSLDSETIQKAYKALISVTQGQKLVGIISHVDYLKDTIEKQIVVTKTRDVGSSVTIKV